MFPLRSFVALLALLLLTASRGLAAGDDAVTFLGNPTHNAVSSTPKLGTPLTKLWSIDLGANVTYPIIAQGMVYATAGDSNSSNSYGTRLFALNAQTGAIVWGPVSITGTYYFGACAYETGKLFVLNFDGLLRSFNATTGVPGWSVQLPGQYAFSSAPTAVNGVIYVGGAGSGGTLYAIDERNGAVLWTQSVENGDNSSPTVTDDAVYVSYAGPQAYKFDLSTGNPLWHYNSGIEGGGGATPVFYDNNLYIRGFFQNNNAYYGGFVLGSDTGNLLDTFGLGYDSNQKPPAFDHGLGIFADRYGNVQAKDVASGTILWTFATGQDSIVTAPLIVNGNVFVGTSGGSLIALNEATGAAVWSTNVGAGITPFGESTEAMAAGESLLVIPAGHQMVAYGAVTSAPSPAALTLTPGSLYPSSPVTGTVTLSDNAPVGGVAVTLGTSDPHSATVPASVTVPAGHLTATFPVTLGATASRTNTHLTLSAAAGGITLNAPLEVLAASWNAVSLCVGSDGRSHLLWNNTDGRTAAWAIDSQYNITSTPILQPGGGWTARDISMDTQGNTHVLWINPDGRMTVWIITKANAITSLPIYQPGGGWAAQALSMDKRGNAHVLWFNTDGSMAVWSITPQGSASSSPIYQPGSEWKAQSLSVDSQGKDHVLWFNPNGRMAVWTIDGSNTVTSTSIFQPGGNWIARKVSVDGQGNNRVLWHNTDGRVAVWTIDGASNVISTPFYQPGGGWVAQGLAADSQGSSRVLWDNYDGRTAVWTIPPQGDITSTPIYQP